MTREDMVWALAYMHRYKNSPAAVGKEEFTVRGAFAMAYADDAVEALRLAQEAIEEEDDASE